MSRIDSLSELLSQLMVNQDVEGMADNIAFPFTMIEDDVSLVFKDRSEFIAHAKLLFQAIGQVREYVITETQAIPIGGALYLGLYSVQMMFADGVRRDPVRRSIIFGDRNGRTVALASMGIIHLAIEKMREENNPLLAAIGLKTDS